MTGVSLQFECQRRDRLLISELAVMRIAHRDSLKVAAGFRSTTRINARLLKLCKAGLIQKSKFSFAGSPALYILTSKGLAAVAAAGEIDATIFRPLKGSIFIEHQLQINQIYLALKHSVLPQGIQCRLWKNLQEPLSKTSPIVPDGYVELNINSQVFPLFLYMFSSGVVLKRCLPPPCFPGLWDQANGSQPEVHSENHYQVHR